MKTYSDLDTDLFVVILRRFNKLIKDMPPSIDIKACLWDIEGEIENNNELNYRQKDAIIARINNYTNGEYGNTKTISNMAYGKQPEKKEKLNGKEN